jgi:serine/threonine-protein kinase HipA
MAWVITARTPAISDTSRLRLHYNWDSIVYRHWQHLAKRCGVADQLEPLIAEIRAATPKVIAKVESLLPKEFPSSVAGPILGGMLASTKKLVAA